MFCDVFKLEWQDSVPVRFIKDSHKRISKAQVGFSETTGG